MCPPSTGLLGLRCMPRARVCSFCPATHYLTAPCIPPPGSHSAQDVAEALDGNKVLQLRPNADRVRSSETQADVALDKVGEYQVQVEARSDFWCNITVRVATT